MDVNIVVDPSLSRKGPTYIVGRLAECMNSQKTPCRMFTPVNKWTGALPNLDIVVGLPTPGAVAKVPTRVLNIVARPIAYQRLLNQLKRGQGKQIVYTFGGVSLDLARTLHAMSVTVVREKFNCAQSTARKILDRAYESLGAPPVHGLDDASIARENEGLAIADAIFCPSPMVAQSLLDLGVPEEKLIRTSYGWEPARFAGESKPLPPYDGVTLTFVGYLCVRKGAHIMLEAWKKAGIKGRLVIAGAIEPIIKMRYGDILSRRDVIYMPYTEDVPGLYRSSDWFIFPTLEEGGPLVTYEAAASGLPSIVSPMGAGAFARDKVDGMVIDSIDPDDWAQVIASLPGRQAERGVMAAVAQARAQDFTWEKVGARRRQALLDKFGKTA